MSKIQFKYHPNVWEQEVFSRSKNGEYVVCQCCENETEFFLENMYTSEDVNCICPSSVASGLASEKYNGDFIQDAEIDKVNDTDKIDELFKKTPGYVSWQGEYWLACCNDFCAYIGDIGTKELEEFGIADEVFAEYDKLGGYDEVREYLVKAGSMAGYLFKCLNCGKYHLWVDAD
ncbi:hypothetical protein [Clostridium tertium]|uniref:CbrC family protein n=1 Tax=Clostridium tertium TaxID=1559 RepID=A0A6N3GSH2_9CLOT